MVYREMKIWPGGKFTVANLINTTRRQSPRIFGDSNSIIAGFKGDERLTASQRLAMQLRITKIMGCPVCLNLLPPLARKAEFDEDQIQDAMNGGMGTLSPDVAAAADWAEAVLLADGDEPDEEDVVESALLTDLQREHILTMTRIEMVVHSLGLAFLPHQVIERARGRN